jgi:hypothetical protein
VALFPNEIVLFWDAIKFLVVLLNVKPVSPANALDKLNCKYNRVLNMLKGEFEKK